MASGKVCPVARTHCRRRGCIEPVALHDQHSTWITRIDASTSGGVEARRASIRLPPRRRIRRRSRPRTPDRRTLVRWRRWWPTGDAPRRQTLGPAHPVPRSALGPAPAGGTAVGVGAHGHGLVPYPQIAGNHGPAPPSVPKPLGKAVPQRIEGWVRTRQGVPFGPP